MESSISSKKRTKTCRIMVKTNSFVRFLEEFTAWQFAFKINWPLEAWGKKCETFRWFFGVWEDKIIFFRDLLTFSTYFDINGMEIIWVCKIVLAQIKKLRSNVLRGANFFHSVSFCEEVKMSLRRTDLTDFMLKGQWLDLFFRLKLAS